MEISKSSPQVTSAKARKERTPSKLFTEYYGSVVLFLVALFVAAAFFVLRPLILRIKETNASIQSQLTDIGNRRAYLASLEQSVAAAQSIAPEALDRVDRALPVDTGVPSLLMQFSSAAARNGVQINSLSFAEVPPTLAAIRAATSSQPVVPINIEVSLKVRTYLDVKRFLADVESSLRLMDVTSISSGNVGISGELSYQIQLRSYIFKPVAPPRS